jgi:RES domain-containing protein
MTRAWRIVREDHRSAAFDGEGAWLFGGRWNSRGTRMVYTSITLSLAALETLVHLNPPVAFKYVAIPIDFDEASTAWRQNKIQLDNGCFKYRTKVFPESNSGGMVLRSRQI